MKIVIAKLIKRKTDDGLVEIMDHIPLGKEYKIDLDSVKKETWYNVIHEKQHEKTVVLDVEKNQWMVLELLQIIDGQLC